MDSVPKQERKKLIDPKIRDKIPIKRQAELLGVSRSSAYYKQKNKDEKQLKKQILQIHEERIYYGSRRISAELKRRGVAIGRKRIRRLMKELKIRAIYPKPKTTFSNAQHKKYPYLLRDVEIKRVHQVWSTDITYIKIKGGWIYLTAIIDWYSRYVITWEISITLEETFCITALEKALRKATPEIFNSDQGVQYTSRNFTKVLEDKNIKISMDGKGRCLDNIFCERLWRSVKYEDVYLKSYDTVFEAHQDLKKYFDFYNNHRPHQSLNYKTPSEVYFQNS